jgi:PHP family Zn ribbon phosphoesterase
VEQRVEELADRPLGFKPEGAIGYKHLLPLSEIIATVLGATYPGAKKIWDDYSILVEKFDNEYTVLINAPKEEMAKIVDPKIAEAIVNVREEKVKVVPGYDGVYGQIILFEKGQEEKEKREESPLHQQKRQQSLFDFM